MKKVALVTLGCSRNETDSEELAARLANDGWELVTNADDADVALINTCGFVEAAKKDSIDAVLEANSLKHGKANSLKKVVAVGCMAERYGKELEAALPEADAILGFDHYADISERLNKILNGENIQAHAPSDRRKLLPVAPAERKQPVRNSKMGEGERVLRKRLDNAPVAPLKIAAGCDRRCTFCAIPFFRGAFVSRTQDEIISEAKWLADNGVSEIFLVSENTTSYGKDLGNIRAMEELLPQLSDIDGISRIRLSYLQPAEMRPTLIDAMTSIPKVVPYFDLSFQHASAKITRSMRRFGDTDKFLDLIAQIRSKAPLAGIRSNFIVGFPGEDESDFQELLKFLGQARLDAIGIFGYSDEDGTEAETLPDKLDQREIRNRVEEVNSLVEQLLSDRANERIGEEVIVLVEDRATQEGRAAHQGPEVDGSTYLLNSAAAVGTYVKARVVATDGADLHAN
jgi:ribosomal protein S12 methylthiotransferase RimO